MTETERNQIKGALLKCAKENENKFTLTSHIVVSSLCRSAVERIEELEKENAELQEKISVLLSCKNCPENKGGWGCEKEYENKCLTQKIVYIKELKEENAQYEKDLINFNENLTKAKELIKKFLEFANNTIEFDPEHPQEHTDLWNELCEKAERFIS